jgi:predicted RNA-binding Zn-ribbon protein involved in translation (DUF1610 family)
LCKENLLILDMDKFTTYDPAIKFRDDYKWPEAGSKQNCPKCETDMQLNKNEKTYFGKPWWCPKCQWQFSEEELDQA